jgi:negative regulator of flagellin synthesis FlgM
MKVTNSNNVNVARIYSENKLKAAGQSGKASKSYDTVEISREGMEIAKFVSMASNMPDEGLDRVEEIKARLQRGTYKVSSEKLASGILNFIQENKDMILSDNKTLEDK